MISKFIIKTNEWYEKLPNLKGSIFYISLIFIPYISLFFISAVFWPRFFYAVPITWVFMVAMWRASYQWIIEFRKNKKSN